MDLLERFWLSLIVIVALLTRLYRLNFPSVVLWDERTFVPMAQWYVEGKYFFDVHPPFGKLCLAAIVAITGFPTDVEYTSMGMEYEDRAYIFLRAWHALWGAALPAIGFATARELGLKLPSSVMVGGMLLLELSMQTIARTAQLDSLLCGLIGLAFLAALKMWRLHDKLTVMEEQEVKDDRVRRLRTSHLLEDYWRWVAICGTAMACAVSTKFTGLAVIGVILVVHVARMGVAVKQAEGRGSKTRSTVLVGRLAQALLAMVTIIAAVYILCFLIHFALLTHSGPGDEMMSDNFRSQLVDSGIRRAAREPAQSALRSFLELHSLMLSESWNYVSDHYHVSAWYEWPILFRGIVYWWNELGDDRHICLYLFGNPLVYWLALFGVFGCLYMFDRSVQLYFTVHKHSSVTRQFLKSAGMLCFAYFANLLPYAIMPRSTFLHAYHPALYFAVLAFGALFDLVFGKVSLINRSRTMSIAAALIILWCTASFLNFSAYTYGFPLSTEQHQSKRWFIKFFKYW